MRASKPIFQGVVDFGLRDVGVRNQPRRLAAQLGKSSIQSFAVIFVCLVATCALIRATGAGRWVVFPLALLWTAALFAFALRSAKRSPIVVVKVTADRPSRAGWLLVAPLFLFLLTALPLGGPLVIPPAVFTVVLVVFLVRGRRRVPDTLRKFQPLLAPDESVLGDGFGMAEGVRGWRDGFRLVVATDRRLLMTGSAARDPFVVIDVPYARVTRFGIEWRYAGRAGMLSVTVADEAGRPETHVVKTMGPANLLSIALALRSHGVPADDPVAVDDAKRGWQEALARYRAEQREQGQRWKPQMPTLDQPTMNTTAFDRGLWLMLVLAGAAFYADPSGSPALLLTVVLGTGVASGYLSGTKSSLAYLVPFNLLLAPAFLFMDARAVVSLMIGLSVVVALGLWAGSALRRTFGGDAVPSAEERPARGTLRYTVGGVSLIRLSAIVVVGLVALVVAGSAAGFDATTLRMAYDEATAKQLPVDGRSNLSGGTASFRYTARPALHELVTDQHFAGGTYDGARWELRSSWTENLNVVSLASYVETPRLDNPAAVARFVARKDRQHARLAGFRVSHTVRVVDGRKGYVWDHGSRAGIWYFAAWFPQPVHSIRVECIAQREKARFKRLCREAMGSLQFR